MKEDPGETSGEREERASEAGEPKANPIPHSSFLTPNSSLSDSSSPTRTLKTAQGRHSRSAATEAEARGRERKRGEAEVGATTNNQVAFSSQ